MSWIDYTIVDTDVGQRIDVFVSALRDDLSRSAVTRLIESGNLLLSGKKTKKNTLLTLGDVISINIPQPTQDVALPQNIPLNIVYEDDDIIIINKQKGMVVHPGAGNPDGTLVNALLYHCGESLSGIGGVMRPGIVHRIDKDTSGLLVVAKNDRAHNGLAAQLSDHSLRRCYHAIVKGIVKQQSGTIDAAIARDKSNRLRMAVDSAGREAITYYKVLEHLKGYSHIEVTLKTGRTHQIRVHMKSINHPVAGDATYGERSNPRLSGQCLHAKVLEFKHPITGNSMKFETELPDYFSNFLRKVRA